MLRALQTYAATLCIEVCAEGVEDPADLDGLHEVGTHTAQGHLLGRPAPQWVRGPVRVARRHGAAQA